MNQQWKVVFFCLLVAVTVIAQDEADDVEFGVRGSFDVIVTPDPIDEVSACMHLIYI